MVEANVQCQRPLTSQLVSSGVSNSESAASDVVQQYSSAARAASASAGSEVQRCCIAASAYSAASIPVLTSATALPVPQHSKYSSATGAPVFPVLQHSKYSRATAAPVLQVPPGASPRWSWMSDGLIRALNFNKELSGAGS